MADCCKTEVDLELPVDPADITIGRLLGMLDAHRALPLVFTYGGRTIRSGYHITEVKAGRFDALDCGGNPESWTEIFIQLWDVDGDRSHMQAAKFASIIRKVTEHVALDLEAKLTFEVSDGTDPMQLHRAGLPTISKQAIQIPLAPRAASCKPRDRWLAEQSQVQGCCQPSTQSPTVR